MDHPGIIPHTPVSASPNGIVMSPAMMRPQVDAREFNAFYAAISGRPALLGGCAGWAVTSSADEDVLWLPILVLGLDCSSARNAKCLIAPTNSASLDSAPTATSAEFKPDGFDRLVTLRCVD